MAIEIEVVTVKGKPLGTFLLSSNDTVKDLKKQISKKCNLPIERQSIRNAIKGKDEKDTTALENLKLESNKVYVKDLGLQIGWDTVFYFEYAGPIAVYVLLWAVPHCFYSAQADYCKNGGKLAFPASLFPFDVLNQICSTGTVCAKTDCHTNLAALLWIFHYGKRLFETAFVHRFSHGTMPIRNLFKNCFYYWGFAYYIAYHVNHPLHTSPGKVVYYSGVLIFLLCEIGNLSIHLLLRDLRPPGTSVRKIPVPNSNPFTKLYNFVSCPNYTYEFGSWIGFTLLTGCLPVLIFALAGLYQMSVWALGKHKQYKKEFHNYPKKRKAILPFLI